MAYIHQEALTGFTAIRPPARSNRFTVLATATLDKETVVLQESKNAQGRGIREHIDTWRHILASEELTTRESHLVQVKGFFTLPLPRSIVPSFVPKSFRNQSAATTFLDQRRPVYVTKYYERGSLRDCLDKAEFISKTNRASSNWHCKIAILKNVATALHNIQLHMQCHSHGGVSSRSVLLDKDGRAFLSWHQSDKSGQDLLSNSNNLRYYSQAVLKSINDALVNNVLWNKDEVLEINHDDMYSFGILAWEIATEELPYEEIESPSLLQLLSQNHNRFSTSAPAPLQQLIDHCTHPELDQRPSWCTVVAELDALDLQILSDLEIEANQGDQAIGGVMATEEQTSTVITITGVPEQDPKSEVVEMMESVLNSTFYRRELPPHLDSFTSASGKRLFKDMILAGTGENFFRMFTSFNTQSDPAFCGVSSLSMVLNALEIDPQKQWRGVWRWYSDEQLDCCASIEEMKLKGITFNQFACLARCHAKVIVKRADRHSLEEFRRDVQMVSQSSDYQLVISFSRAALGQTGSGHFSPIGGYHAREDKVLVLDTARFKYPPFWATVAELWESLLPEDPETGLCRGYFVISATSKQKLEIQKQRMQNQLSSSTSASSSSVSLPLLPDPISRPNSPSPTPFDAMVVVPESANEMDAAAIVGEGDRSECDCSCPKKVVEH